MLWQKQQQVSLDRAAAEVINDSGIDKFYAEDGLKVTPAWSSKHGRVMKYQSDYVAVD